MPEETKGKKEGEKDVEMKDADEKKDKDGKDAKKEKEEPPPKTPRTCLRPHKSYPQSFHENCLC